MSGTSDVCAVAQVAQLATTTYATNFVLTASGTICTTSAQDIIYIMSLAVPVLCVGIPSKRIIVIVDYLGKQNLIPETVQHKMVLFWVYYQKIAQKQ